MPGRDRFTRHGRATSIELPSLERMARSAAPDSPPNADPGPQASVAAFQSPSRPTVGRPTAVHTWPEAEEPPGAEAVSDRLGAESKVTQLAAGDHTVL